ncbi:Aste57867_14458 [Aphanomyces stellatus]|uniref:RING-type E3 ubiquitin transferase n=1 Tax=Aphanomyces stellatus TaxID=120398 RepID=A0A485L1A1_9STRA|nr:hypothetical protein As57867_014404 [Aphanomyces stellatus]VFT91280.1 Aste57867_14458 [Aphanomyces stellatus]
MLRMSPREIDGLKAQLEAMKKQVEYERKEKEYWMDKYLKLRHRHTNAFPTSTTSRSRRNSRDEDEYVVRPPPPSPIAQSAPQADDISSDETTAIDLTTPRATTERVRANGSTHHRTRDGNSHQPRWSRLTTSHDPLPLSSNDFVGSSATESSSRSRWPRSLPLELDPRQDVRPSVHSLASIPARRRLGMADSLMTSMSTVLPAPPSRRAALAPASVSPTDPNEEASLALALALQEEEVREAQLRRSRAVEAQEMQMRAARDELQMLRESLGQAYTTNNNTIMNSARAPLFVNPDTMSYDELLRLGEQMGDVKKERWQEKAIHVLSRLPTQRWQGLPEGENSMCIVCQDEYKPNDHVLTLPCAHMFHYDCVQGWIQDNNECPMCKMPIAED